MDPLFLRLLLASYISNLLEVFFLGGGGVGRGAGMHCIDSYTVLFHFHLSLKFRLSDFHHRQQ